jgi:hypothetical protein
MYVSSATINESPRVVKQATEAGQKVHCCLYWIVMSSSQRSLRWELEFSSCPILP